MPAEYLAPWFGVTLSSRFSVTDVVRERRLVRFGDPEQFARRYPRTAIALCSHHAVVAAPLLIGTTLRGALLHL
ncbi:hypothetical protein [Streptomyces sp. NRRL S-813]|uniref:hypothetical protein n=1 Tax=Streptomyces sp. NRRL S-813 TaxID=1463919 RepID=UPI0004C15F9D|nr:hypothetical protein [Streptomyces sp. NRRL S-813]